MPIFAEKKNRRKMKKLVALTGAGMSAESGFSTFRDAGGLWEKYPVQQVASHDGWDADPVLVNNFYNGLRKQLIGAKPNRGHQLLADLETHFDVTVITQNVDNLHERAGSSHVIHLHGDLMKVCSRRDTDNPHFIEELPPENCEVKPGQKAGDGSLLRPFIVFFQEAVPMISVAAEEVAEADIFIIIGTSLNGSPAAGLIHYVRPGVPIYLIDPKDVGVSSTHIHFIRKTASEGMEELTQLLNGK